MEWMLMPFRRYAQFSGRARRKEYWMFTLLNAIVVTVCYALMLASGGAGVLSTAASNPSGTPLPGAVTPGPLFWIGLAVLAIYGLAVIVPSIAVTVRRLHDRNLTGWIYLGIIVASFIPVFGLIAGIGLIVLMALPGTLGPNKYGADPLDPSQSEVFA